MRRRNQTNENDQNPSSAQRSDRYLTEPFTVQESNRNKNRTQDPTTSTSKKGGKAYSSISTDKTEFPLLPQQRLIQRYVSFSLIFYTLMTLVHLSVVFYALIGRIEYRIRVNLFGSILFVPFYLTAFLKNFQLRDKPVNRFNVFEYIQICDFDFFAAKVMIFFDAIFAFLIIIWMAYIPVQNPFPVLDDFAIFLYMLIIPVFVLLPVHYMLLYRPFVKRVIPAFNFLAELSEFKDLISTSQGLSSQDRGSGGSTSQLVVQE